MTKRQNKPKRLNTNMQTANNNHNNGADVVNKNIIRMRISKNDICICKKRHLHVQLKILVAPSVSL
jgi:hypothetical protein